ncbi:hypothetical protein ACSFA0_25405 [Variovorax sp. LT1P1]|uniref:hypothetical protein n=1 Tax=Variovorax sp. LT1P1 TaxID=3443730 RepID=UPI003F46BEDE
MSDYDAHFFRRLVRASSSALCTTAVQLADRDDLDTMDHLLTVVGEYARGETVCKRNDVASPITFWWSMSAAVSEALRPVDPTPFQASEWTPAQTGLFTRYVDLLKFQPEHERLLGTFASHLAADVRDARAFLALAAVDANLEDSHYEPSGGKLENALNQALSKGNLAAVTSMLGVIPENSVHRMSNAAINSILCRGRLSEVETPNGLLGCATAATPRAGVLLTEFWNALEEKSGPDVVATLQMAMVTLYLARCVRDGQVWQESVLLRLLGPDGLDAARSGVARAAAQLNDEFPASGEPELEMARAAVRAHCAPVLALRPRVVAAGRDNLIHGDVSIGAALDQSGYFLRHQGVGNYPCVSEHLQATIGLLLHHGHSLEVAEYEKGSQNPLSAMHVIAKSMLPHRSVKQVVLLEMGASTEAKDTRGWRPLSHVSGAAAKEDWKAVERSFHARRKTSQLLDAFAPTA